MTFFVKDEDLDITKLEYISQNLSDPWLVVYLPLISTSIILTLLQFVANGAYWLDLSFMTWRIDRKNSIERKQLLTLEQSIQLRTEIREQEQNFDKLLEKKNSEINLLAKQVAELQAQAQKSSEKASTSASKIENSEKIQKPRHRIGTEYSLSDYNRLSANKKVLDSFESVAKYIRDYNQFPQGTDSLVKEYFITNEIVEANYDTIGNKNYDLTFKGRELYKVHFNAKYSEA